MNAPLSASDMPVGFTFAAAHCGLKRARLDLGILISEVPAAAAAVFTTNQVVAAPVVVVASPVVLVAAPVVVVAAPVAVAIAGLAPLVNKGSLVEELVRAGAAPLEPGLVLAPSCEVVVEGIVEVVVVGVGDLCFLEPGDAGPAEYVMA